MVVTTMVAGRAEGAAPFAVTIQLENGHARLSWPAGSAPAYQVLTRESLSTGSWNRAATVTPGSPAALWTDPEAAVATRFYRILYEPDEGVTSLGRLVHPSRTVGLLQDLGSVAYATARDRMKQMAADGEIILPVPMPGLAPFDDISMDRVALHEDDMRRTLVVRGSANMQGQPVELMIAGAWSDANQPADGFVVSVKWPRFRMADWVDGLSGSVFDALTLDGSVVTLATAPLSLDAADLPGDAAAFYGAPELEVEAGLNFSRTVNLAEAPGLRQPLHWLGFDDTPVVLEGVLGVDVNAFFHRGTPLAAPRLHLRARLPASQPAGFPTWLKPIQRILDFSNDPSLQVVLRDDLMANPDGQALAIEATTGIDTGGGRTSVTLTGHLAKPWSQPFGLGWLTLRNTTLGITFGESASGDAALAGTFDAGSKSIAAGLTLTESPSGRTASFRAAVDRLDLGDLLDLLRSATGSEPFGPGLARDALVFTNARFSFDSSDQYSIAVSATSTILDGVAADVLVSFVKPVDSTPLLLMGMDVHNFRLSALYSGIAGTLAGDLEFPGVAFTVLQELPEGSPPSVEIASTSLNPTARDFYRRIYGDAPFTLELRGGVHFSGTFEQSRLPRIVVDSLGMDPAAGVLLDGALDLRLGALTGGGVAKVEQLDLRAVLPPPTRPRAGWPEWLQNLESRRARSRVPLRRSGHPGRDSRYLSRRPGWSEPYLRDFHHPDRRQRGIGDCHSR